MPKRGVVGDIKKDCPGADKVKEEWGTLKQREEGLLDEDEAKQLEKDKNEWRSRLIKEYQECKKPVDACNLDEVGDLVDLLAEMSVAGTAADIDADVDNDNMGDGPVLKKKRGGKMVGGFIFEHLVKLNRWLSGHTYWSPCAIWFLEQIWEKLQYAGHIAYDVGLTAMGNSDTETFQYAVYALGAMHEKYMELTVPYMNVLTNYLNESIKENESKMHTYLPDVDPDKFNTWLNDTPILDKIYWTLVTMQLSQVLGLMGTVAVAGSSVITSVGYYGVIIAYYITQSKLFTGALLLHAGFHSLPKSTQEQLIKIYNNADGYIAGKIDNETDLNAMMVQLKSLPNNAKQVTKVILESKNKLLESELQNQDAKKRLETTEKLLDDAKRVKASRTQTEDVENTIKRIEDEIKAIYESMEKDKENTSIDDDDDDLGGGKRKSRRRRNHKSKKTRKGKKGKKGRKSRRKH